MLQGQFLPIIILMIKILYVNIYNNIKQYSLFLIVTYVLLFFIYPVNTPLILLFVGYKLTRITKTYKKS